MHLLHGTAGHRHPLIVLIPQLFGASARRNLRCQQLRNLLIRARAKVEAWRKVLCLEPDFVYTIFKILGQQEIAWNVFEDLLRLWVHSLPLRELVQGIL